ncbi:MAG: HAD family hydrolase [Clostridiales bacterium]|nr:HAD family hydrolase [Clostridiales bacterium]
MKRAVIFDMDGTLWDSVDNIVISWNQALPKIGIKDLVITREQLLGLMGKTMDKFAEALFPQYPQKKGMELFHVLELAENEYLRQHGAVLLGDVEAVFRRLHDQGCGVCIVSNCQAGYIEAFLAHYHLDDLVDDLECYGNTGCGKVDNLKAVIARQGLEKYWYLGDTQGDYDACAEAGVPFIWASYGFGTVEAKVPQADSLEEILQIV